MIKIGMKWRKMFRGIKSFLSGNYRVDLKTQQIQYFMIFLLGLYHFVMIALYFTLFGMNPMSMVNILSVLIYFLCYFSAKRKNMIWRIIFVLVKW